MSVTRPAHYLLPVLAILSFCFLPQVGFASTSTTIGPRKNYRCNISDSGQIQMSKKQGTVFKTVTISRELRTQKNRKSKLERDLAYYSSREGSLSARVRNLKALLSETKNTITAINKCAGLGVKESACSVVQGQLALSARIANGNRCAASGSPVVLLKLYNALGEDAGSCSGTVIKARTILTAAHCFEGAISKVIAIVGGRSYEAASFAVHPSYDGNAINFEKHDVTVLSFSENLHVIPIALLSNKGASLGEIGIIAGYGDTERTGFGLLRAAKVVLSLVSQQDIEIKYASNSATGNTCQGDSGGPLLLKRGRTWYVAGVTSNGEAERCGEDDISRFANTLWEENLNFIKQHIQ